MIWFRFIFIYIILSYCNAIGIVIDNPLILCYPNHIKKVKSNDEESTHESFLQRIFRYRAMVLSSRRDRLRGRKRGNGEHGFRAVHRAAGNEI